jgi:hypothetical protein
MGIIYLVIISAILLFLNLYLRVKVFSYYKSLVKAKVEFPASYIFNKKRIEDEVIPRYPDSKEDIRMFTRNIRISVGLASVFLCIVGVLYFLLRIYS